MIYLKLYEEFTTKLNIKKIMELGDEQLEKKQMSISEAKKKIIPEKENPKKRKTNLKRPKAPKGH